MVRILQDKGIAGNLGPRFVTGESRHARALATANIRSRPLAASYSEISRPATGPFWVSWTPIRVELLLLTTSRDPN